MMKHTYDSLNKPSISEMNKDEIFAIFERYKFQNQMGTTC